MLNILQLTQPPVRVRRGMSQLAFISHSPDSLHSPVEKPPYNKVVNFQSGLPVLFSPCFKACTHLSVRRLLSALHGERCVGGLSQMCLSPLKILQIATWCCHL